MIAQDGEYACIGVYYMEGFAQVFKNLASCIFEKNFIRLLI